MWKWLGGCLLVVVVFLVAATWWGYRAMQSTLSPDGSASVTIGASPQRVYASLADGDSLATWMAQGNTVSTTRRGPLSVGDTIHIESRAVVGMPAQRMTWRVKEAVPNTVLELEIRPDTSDMVLATRRDSLVSVGDSTTVISKVTSPFIDSLSAERDARKSGTRTLGLSGDLLLSMFKVQAKLELQQLKQRLESASR
jgi:uncharacterized protein YndB with AHSA1/START domain